MIVVQGKLQTLAVAALLFQHRGELNDVAHRIFERDVPVSSSPSPRPAPRLPPPPINPIALRSRLVPIEDPTTWFSADDYPPSALRKGEQGTVRFVLHVDGRGVPTSCSITESSGVDTLDDTTCAIALRHARFQPPRDQANATWQRRVAWRLP